MSDTISESAQIRRKYWIEELQNLSGDFAIDTTRLENELEQEIKRFGVEALIDHLRLCGSIPESYSHDSSEEKLYSKYTDYLLSFAFRSLGLKSIVLKERADAADVEAFAKDYSFVADAKSFRLSRTAKNQKDFKIQAIDTWKRGKPYAMVVCPIYQLPSTNSQIYLQATTRNVCIFSYSHLVLILTYSILEGAAKARNLLTKIFQTVKSLNPTKSAPGYWLGINSVMLSYSKKIETLWHKEKDASAQSITLAKEEALTFLSSEREKIMRMTHAEALHALLKAQKIESKIKTITSISENKLFEIN